MNKNLEDTVKYILKDDRIDREAKKFAIELLYEHHRDELDTELREYLCEQYAGAILELSSAALPVGGLGKAGVVVGEQALKKYLGRKISKEIGAGAVSGAVSGAVYGAGRGKMEGENPFITAAQDALAGGITGGALGAAAGNIEKAVRSNKLTTFNVNNNMNKEEIEKLRQLGKSYYKDYLERTHVKNNLIGKINFPSRQYGEIKLHNYPNIPYLPEQIKKSKISVYSNDKPNRNDADYFNKLYNKLNDKNFEYVIRKNKNKPDNDFYQIKHVDSNLAYPDQNQIHKIEPNNITKDIINTDSVFLYDDQVHKSVPNNIITNNSGNVNGFANNLNNNSYVQLSPTLLASGISNSDKHIFTREEIAAMSRQEFEANEAEIMEQMKNGQIHSAPKDYSGFINPQSGDDRIFTREDLRKMTRHEYEENESAIMAQLRSIGIPTNGELAEAEARNGVIYVHAYTRDDGTEVRGYYRSLPRR